MNFKTFTLGFLFLFAANISFSQTTLFFEDFEGGAGGFTLNTMDQASTPATAINRWVVNNEYTGGGSSFLCLGFQFPYTVINTPQQPAGISNSPTSNYMHILADAAAASGILNSNFIAADGLCSLGEVMFSKMSADVSTLGMTGTTVSFWWLFGGGTSVFGQLFYSTDGGTNWTIVPGNYSGQTSWTQATVTLPAFDNQASLRFGFRFVNQVDPAPIDPAFSIDDFRITTMDLPIELIRFDASVLDRDKIQLDWATATEINNDYFAIERSRDGLLFEEIGRLDGLIESNQIQEYSFLDSNPYRSHSYYRLKQVDLSGLSSYSEVKSVFVADENQIHVYPNPLKDISYISIPSDGLVSMYSISGQLIFEKRLTKTEEEYEPIDMSSCPKALIFYAGSVIMEFQKKEY